jgi:hypothetical protein
MFSIDEYDFHTVRSGRWVAKFVESYCLGFCAVDYFMISCFLYGNRSSGEQYYFIVNVPEYFRTSLSVREELVIRRNGLLTFRG